MYNDPSFYAYPPPHYQNYPAHPYHYAPYWVWDRDYPSVDTKIMSHSVTTSQNLLKDASLLIRKLAEPAIARQLMANAQIGNQKEVDRIVNSFGVESTILTSFTPSAIQFIIDPRGTGKPCCEMTLSLKWGE
ncbi:hypothetical protein SAMN04487897_12085 [Paenibacillus sp. yr247]|uniref:hypothetical protein n=1 Tax=Paenibacillus sp. yr247 TaxID=1761880 RepID=UPI000886C701|nr:hypothetical protein [Paenibacillus sp. yr247]SDO72868.1 hypothetical protein SAMN04487897_12085 [Paenibacillus sp. yr247]